MANKKENNNITTFSGTYYYGLGKRKNASAQVRLYKGSGKLLVNGREEYFNRDADYNRVFTPFESTGENKENYDISVLVKGGGITGQAESIRHGLSRALVVMNPDYRKLLKSEKLLSRDPRVVMKKIFGQPKARKGKQWSKR